MRAAAGARAGGGLPGGARCRLTKLAAQLPPRLLAALAAAALALAAFRPVPAYAERADRDKDANVTADHSTLDDLRQVQVLTGHVVLIKGTMRLGGDRMEHRQDEQGYQFYVVTAAPGELASFHERRDPVRVGVESTLDGFAERIEYDDRSDRVILYRRALVKRFENGEQRDELSGSRIIYDARQSNYDVDGRNPDGTGNRVHITIAPRAGAAAEGPAHSVANSPANPPTAPAKGTSASPQASPADSPPGASTGASPDAMTQKKSDPASAPGAGTVKPPLPVVPPPAAPDLHTERMPPEGVN